jgi:hypothetical protein
MSSNHHMWAFPFLIEIIGDELQMISLLSSSLLPE